MIAVPFSAITDQLADICKCLKDYAHQPGVMPCNSYPFIYTGSVSQADNTHVASPVFQVPKGQIATITRISLAERYPGVLYGGHFMLLVNDNFSPSFPRLDHPTGTGMETGQGTRICLDEQDIVSVMIQCSWTPVTFTGIVEATYVQTLFPFEISGYFELKQVA